MSPVSTTLIATLFTLLRSVDLEEYDQGWCIDPLLLSVTTPDWGFKKKLVLKMEQLVSTFAICPFQSRPSLNDMSSLVNEAVKVGHVFVY